jgi:hypothetical protein
MRTIPFLLTTILSNASQASGGALWIGTLAMGQPYARPKTYGEHVLEFVTKGKR